jgi:XTP/dITP diphosphohydrolase
MRVSFVTTNKYKFREAQDILKDYPVELEWLNREYEENHDESIEEIARTAAAKLAHELGKPVIVEDTGLFFEAFNHFPGALPKFVFNGLGFKGILKLLKGEPRGAYFKTVAGFSEPGRETLLFEGTMRGIITEEVHDEDKDEMPYDKIFMPEGKTITLSGMTLQEKNAFSQRAQAFRKFGEYIKNR